MRFLFVLWLGFFCTSPFGQDSLCNQITPGATPGHSSTAANSSSQTQRPSQPPATPTHLVDAPSATKISTCTQADGKPCPEWLQTLIGQFPRSDVSEHWNGHPDHFFTFGNARRALHPDKKSWMVFTLAHAGMWAAAVTAVRNNRSSGQEAHSGYPAVAFLTGLDFLVFKMASPALSVGPPIYATIQYSKTAAK